jgi:fructosamine-3-kinase
MTLPDAVRRYAEAQGWGAIVRAERVGGGCINDAHLLHTARGPRLFFKHNPTTPPDMFAREAEGLRALAAANGPRVPRCLSVGPDFILLEYLAPAPHAPRAWEIFAERLAQLHTVTQPRFGFDHDNYLGQTPQPNRWEADGHTFFAEQRLLYQGRLAQDHGLLQPPHLRQLQRLAGRLRELIPEQPASLLHGDLWGGNVITGPDGHLCLIDPAAHYGWAEAELAMTALFGGFPASFYAAYESARPLAPGYRQRFDIYNLYHLLNHLNLFGPSYLGDVEAILVRYGA